MSDAKLPYSDAAIAFSCHEPRSDEFQSITATNTALVANSMMGHQTALKPLDEEWTGHSENAGSLLG